MALPRDILVASFDRYVNVSFSVLICMCSPVCMSVYYAILCIDQGGKVV